MPWADVAPVLQTEAGGVADSGPVHLGDVRFRDKKRFGELFKWPRTEDGIPIPGADTTIRGTRVVRVAGAERWGSIGYTTVEDEYKLIVLSAIVLNDATSERQFNELVERIWARFRVRKTIGDALVIDAAKTPSIAYTEYDGHKCHIAEIGINTIERLAIVPGTPPAQADSLAGRRDTYENVANQLATIIEATGDGAGIVHRERPRARTMANVQDQDEVEQDDPDPNHTGHVTHRMTRLYRASDEETRLPGNLITASSQWVVNHSRSWPHDLAQSYDAAQRYIDVLRAAFRGFGNLGNTLNPTQALSSPLQISEIGMRRVGREIVSFLESSIRIEEVVHV